MTTQLLIKPEEQAQLTEKQIPFLQILIIDFGHFLSGPSLWQKRQQFEMFQVRSRTQAATCA